MEDIKKRLREAADNCLSSYESWQKEKKDAASRESLMEAVHEIRKVASRLEIELAISERDEMAQRPIPIPPHRDAQRRSQDGDDIGNIFQDRGPDRESRDNRSHGGHRRRPQQRREGGPRNYPSES